MWTNFRLDAEKQWHERAAEYSKQLDAKDERIRSLETQKAQPAPVAAAPKGMDQVAALKLDEYITNLCPGHMCYDYVLHMCTAFMQQ